MIRTVGTLALIASAAWAQASAPPAFEVASIRPGQPGRESIDQVPGSLTMRNMRLRNCIRWAFRVVDAQISGPEWLNETWFDITAKAATPAKEPELRLMMQTLLAERFKLEFHRQTKEIPALILTVAKGGHKLKEVEAEGSPSFKTGKLNLTGSGATIYQLIDFLSRELRHPIVDETGLTGRYDYFMDINAYITPEMRNSGGPPPEAHSIIAQAMQAQLGLKVESKKAPLEVLIIDRIEKNPTEN
jgi:uncharacterized protein (TIGR03435 family)